MSFILSKKYLQVDKKEEKEVIFIPLEEGENNAIKFKGFDRELIKDIISGEDKEKILTSLRERFEFDGNTIEEYFEEMISILDKHKIIVTE